MKVTYIVSAYDRPDMLRCCLASLAVQTDRDFEVIVADNSKTFAEQQQNAAVVSAFHDSRFGHRDTDCIKTVGGWDCYWSAEYVAYNWAKGDWLCFPSDDSYYVPVFQERLLTRAKKDNLQLVYCDMVHGRSITPEIGSRFDRYERWFVEPRVNHIDKTGFLIKRSSFGGFVGKNRDAVGPASCDGLMIEDLVQRWSIRHGKVDEVLMVHN